MIVWRIAKHMVEDDYVSGLRFVICRHISYTLVCLCPFLPCRTSRQGQGALCRLIWNTHTCFFAAIKDKCSTPQGIGLFHTPFRKRFNNFMDIRFCTMIFPWKDLQASCCATSANLFIRTLPHFPNYSMVRMKKTEAYRPCLNHLSGCIQHVFYKNPVPSRRVIHKHVGHRTHQFAVLNNRTAAHK